MAFSVNYGRDHRLAARRSAPASATRVFVTVAVLFGLFCIYDYSAYGDGYVSAALGVAQRSFQELMGRFRVRL